MRCYFTGEECDCGGDLETECPHDVMETDIDWIAEDDIEVERNTLDMSERLDRCQAGSR